MSPNERKDGNREGTEIDPERVSHDAEPVTYPEPQQEQDEDLAGEGSPALEPLEQRDA